MKDIQVVNKLNKDACSLTTLVIDSQEFPLTEKEWERLLSQITTMRPDLNASYTDVIEELEDAKERIRDLEDIVDAQDSYSDEEDDYE